MSGWMLISDAMVPSLQPQAGGCRSLWRYPVCVCVSKTTSLCLAGTWDQPSCPMLTKAAAVTDVLWFRDSFWDI